MPRIRLLASTTALALALAAAPSPPAHAKRVTPPPVPAKIQVPAESQAFLEAHAVGTQDYICLPSGAGFAWVLFGPQATLFSAQERQVATHFLSSNPLEGGTPRVAWQHSRDTSTVWGMAIASSLDPAPSSRWMRSPGSWFRGLEPKRDRGVVASWRRPPSSSG